MKKSITKTITLFTILLLTGILLCGALFALAGVPNRAEALVNTGSAVKAGDGEELWNSDGNYFNDKVITDLTNKLFGSEDYVAYIKTNGTSDYNTYGKYVQLTSGSPSQYYVVQSKVINAALGNTNGLVVKLGGFEWIVTSLTLSDNAEKGETDNVVATLLLADAYQEKTSKFFNGENSQANVMYSSSTLRNNLLSWNEFKLFSDGTVNGFADAFLVQPKNIKYQEIESQTNGSVLRKEPFCDSQPALNEAYGNVNTQQSWFGLINPQDVFNGVRYDEWKNDYIFIPSVTETGSGNRITESNIWGISQKQRDSSNNFWWRSGYMHGQGMYYVYSTTYGTTSDLSNECYIRPAIHLNLTEALKNTKTVLNNPENVETIYNSANQTIKTVYDSDSTKASWYNTKWYEHANNYVSVIYPEGGMKNVGTYWVKAEITQKWIDDINAEVDTEGAEKGWTAEEIAEAKEKRKPQFKGDPDTTDGEHMESDTVRWFKFIIKPKELTVNKPTYSTTTGVLTAPTLSNPSEAYESVYLATKITGVADNGTVIDQINEVPNMKGTYTAQAVIVKSATDLTEDTESNYAIKDAASCTCQVVVNRGKHPIPFTAETTKTYSGEEQRFALSNYSSDWTDLALLTLPDGMTLEGSDDDGWYLAVTDAGTYTVTASIKQEQKVDWCWDTGNFAEEVIADRTFSVTVSRKTLLVDFTSSTGAFLLQTGASVTFGAEPSNQAERDDVKITLEYFNAENSTARVPVPNGKLDASTLNPGSYYLVATLVDSAATGNKNYSLEGGEVRQEFTVSAKNIVVDSVNWQYTQNNGVPTPIASGMGASSTAPVAVTYNGIAFVFALNTNGLADAGVKVDATYGTNGYTNSSQLNATDNAVAMTVRLIPFDDGWAFNDANGKPLDNQYKDFTLYVKVNKADVDFSAVEWSADELEFNAVNQQVTIKSGFPSFLSPIYGHPSPSTNVGSYTTRVNGVTVTNATVAANYNIPTSAQVAANANLTHNWEIVKKRILVTWQTVEETAGGTVIFVPCVSDNSVGAIVYTYYNNDKTVEMTLDEIFAEYSQVQTQTYWVCAKLKAAGASGTAYNETNCVLIEGSTDVSATGSFQAFTTGDNKTPVRVGILQDTVVYNKQPQPATVDFQGGNLTIDDFTVTYKIKGADGTFAPFSGVPTNAGEYKVVIELDNGQTGSYAITGQCEFDYIIEKFTYDLSGMKWVDTLNGNAEYTGPYTYAPNSEHNLSFVGGDEVDGLEVKYTTETEQNLTGMNAKDYRVVVTFEVRDSLNYNVPDDIEFTWTILPFTPDLSGVTWNYHTDGPFIFTIIDGVPVKYSVHLSGIPAGMEELIIYGDDTGEYSDAGSHITTFSINESHENRSNYGELVFGSGLETRLVWEIKPLLVDKPTQRQTQTFRAEGYSFAEITNLPEDWAQYFEVEVLDSEKNVIQPTNGTWTFMHVDRYQIKIMFKQGMNGSHGGTTDNVKWSDNGRIDYSVVLTLEKLVLEVNGWTDDAEGYARPTLNANNVTEIETYFDYILTNKETGANVGLNEKLEYETSYTVALKLKEEFSGNVAVMYLGHEVEETTPYGFLTGVDPLADDPENFFRKPTDKELHIEYRYTGKEITFKLGDWFVESKMQILSGVLAATDEGIYQVRIGFKKGANSAWGSADDFDRTPVTVEFVISADAKIADRFVLKEGVNVPFKFQYGDFTEEGKIEEYAYSADKPLFVTRLCLNDTLALLLAQFENGADIKAFDAKGAAITDLSTVLSTGMMLRLMDGDTVLNQLTLSVLGDINGDGRITVQDKGLLNLQLLGKRTFEGAELLACDINGDGRITVQDKGLLNLQLLGKRNIYDGLSLKTLQTQAVHTAAVEEVARAVDALPSAVEKAADVAASDTVENTADVSTSATPAFSKDVLSKREDTAPSSCPHLLQSGGAGAEIVIPDMIEQSRQIILNTKRYAICDRKEWSL